MLRTVSFFVTGAGILLAATGTARAAVLYADASLDYQAAPAGQSTAYFNGGTGLADTLGTGRWNYYSNAVGGANTLLTFGIGGNAGQSMYRVGPDTSDTMPAVSDTQIWMNVPPPGLGYLQLHAGPDNGHASALMRWTAGANQGTDALHIQGSITHAIDQGSARLDIHVDGVPQYSQVLTGTTTYTFNLAGLRIASGQNVDFYLFNNNDGDGGDAASLRVTIDSGPIWSEYFNGITGLNLNGQQYQSGLNVGYSGSMAGWNASGAGAIHGVERTAGDWAAMIWSADSAPQQNVLTVAAGIPANAAGVAYAVSFDVAPAVYQNPSQATTTDQLRIDVLRADDSILQTYFSTPGAWAGSETFHLDGFRYVGDGSGDVRLRIMAASVTGRFAGAIDNLTVSFAVPEPATLTLLGAGLLGLLVCARRKRR